MFSDDLQELRKANRYRSLLQLAGAQGPVVQLDGREVLNFCSNDYLGLAADPRLAQAAAKAAAEIGFGAGASRLLAGNFAAHESLEQEIAAFRGTQSALLFASGYQANCGAIAAIVGPNDLLLSDALNHASIVDGARLSRAKVEIFAHRDLAGLERILQTEASRFRRRLIITESVFSMEGTVAPLKDLWALAERYDCLLYVDDAHGFGVLGTNGEGAVAPAGLPADHPKVIQMVTLGKALGGSGAALCGTHELREILINSARSFIFATALPPILCAGVSEALRIVRSEPLRRANLSARCTQFSAGLKALGFPVLPESRFIPIQPVMVGAEKTALALSDALLAHGILARAIRPPTVPEGACRIRFSLSAAHEAAQIEKTLEVLSQLMPGKSR